MAGLFIDTKVAPELAKDPEAAGKLEEVCPVGILAAKESGDEIVQDNLDECTPVSYLHLRAHENKAKLVCRILLEKKKTKTKKKRNREEDIYRDEENDDRIRVD